MRQQQSKRREFRQSVEQVRECFAGQLRGHLQLTATTHNSELQFWNVAGNMVIIQVFTDGGWCHYLPGKENKLGHVHTEVQRYLELPG